MKTPLTPLDLVRRGVNLYPSNVAVIEPGGPQFTYRQWGERIFRLARAVQAAGYRGRHVAVLSPNTHGGLLTYAAVPWAASVLVPLNNPPDTRGIRFSAPARRGGAAAGGPYAARKSARGSPRPQSV